MNLSAHGISSYTVSSIYTFGTHEADCYLANRQHGIRLYRDEASRLNINESILLPDNNFAVILSVHHNLHCLVRNL